MSSIVRKRGMGLKLYGLAVFLFLYFPLVIVLIFSFSPTKTMVGMQGVTLRWYEELFRDRGLLTALGHTVLIGLSAVVVAVVLPVGRVEPRAARRSDV